MKLKSIFFIVLLIALTQSCSYQLSEEPAPNDLIPKDSFTMILEDIMVIEAFYKIQNSSVNHYREGLPKAVDSILTNYGIDTTRLMSSMDYYSMHQEELIDIYKTIQDSLTLRSVTYREYE